MMIIIISARVGPKDVELLPLISGVAYAMVGRCNSALVVGEAGRFMEHAVTKGWASVEGLWWVRCPACWFSWLSRKAGVVEGMGARPS